MATEMTAEVAGTKERLAFLAAGSAFLYCGVKRGSWSLSLLGVDVLCWGATGYSFLGKVLGVGRKPEARASVPYETGVRVDESMTIQKPPEEIYRFWRNFENLPRFMERVVSVQNIDGKRSHWVVRGPGGRLLEWDAEIINEVENELIGWRSLPGADVDNAGSVRFEQAPSGMGTEVKVSLQYVPPGGKLGAAIGELLGADPTRQLLEDLYRLKRLMESEAGAVRLPQAASA
jgi:uncharacterized membrane protein